MKISHAVTSRSILTVLVALTFGAVCVFYSDVQAAANTGESLFKKHCTSCHANGGNIIKPDKSLSRKDREKHGVKTAKDIVKLMRKPSDGMTAFNKKEVSDKEAKSIAEYILKTFK